MELGRSTKAVFALGIAILFLDGKAWAYGDPGSGALLWQLLVAAGVGVIFTIRRMFAGIRLFRGNKIKGETERAPGD